MTDKQFLDWQYYHSSMFPRFNEWLIGMGGGGEGKEPQQVAELRGKQWRDALIEFDADDVKAASHTLWKMPVSERAGGYGNHLSLLLEIMRRPKGRPEIARRQVNCSLCLDSGLVYVTAKPGFALFSGAGLPMPHGIYASVSCVCERGPFFPADYQGPHRAKFDGYTMEVWKPKAVDAHERLDRMARRGEAAANLARKLGNFMRLPQIQPVVVNDNFVAEMDAIDNGGTE